MVNEKSAEEAKAALLPKSVYVNRESLRAARLAAGAAVDLTTAVVRSEVQNGFALVRPPGHHASKDSANGFCLFNNAGWQFNNRLRPIFGPVFGPLTVWDTSQ